MGDFFSSPQQRAAQSLYEAAVSGKPIGAGLISGMEGAAAGQIMGATASKTGAIGGDILSRTASLGGPTSGTEGMISKATQPLLSAEQQSLANLGVMSEAQFLNLMMQQLGMGISGMSSSSTFGDIMGGLMTLGNMATGAGALMQGIKYQPTKINYMLPPGH